MIKTTQRQAMMPTTGLSLPYSDEILTRSQTGIGSFQWAPVTNQLDMSPNLWRLLGMDPVFSPVRKNFLHFIHPSQRPRARRELRGAVSRKESSFEGIYRMVTSDADKLRMFLVRALIAYEDDLATKVRGVAIDVTSVPRLLMTVGRK